MSKSTEKMSGTIERLIPDKKTGFIKVIGSDEEFYFLANQLLNGGYEALQKGKKVAFIAGSASINGGRRFANEIEVLEAEQHKIVESQQKPKSTSAQPVTNGIVEGVVKIFGEIGSCNNPDDFEDAVFVLLRALGIHRLYQYDRKTQAGQADGFFIIENLAVMYDCTLRNDFEEHKREQIENYVNKLNNKANVKISIKKADGGSKVINPQITGKTKQVWVITKNATREIEDYDGIKIKEVCVNDLVKVLATRLHLGLFEADDLSAKLTLIDRA